MMLDTRTTFDSLVRRHAGDDEQAERILGNRFYRNIAGALSGTQEYMAAEKLYELSGDDRFDLVVIDTPPTRNALDFLDAPERLTRFLDHRLYRILMTPTRLGLRVMNVAAQVVPAHGVPSGRGRGDRRCHRVLPGLRRHGGGVPGAGRHRDGPAAGRFDALRPGRVAPPRHRHRGLVLRREAPPERAERGRGGREPAPPGVRHRGGDGCRGPRRGRHRRRRRRDRRVVGEPGRAAPCGRGRSGRARTAAGPCRRRPVRHGPAPVDRRPRRRRPDDDRQPDLPHP